MGGCQSSSALGVGDVKGSCPNKKYKPDTNVLNGAYGTSSVCPEKSGSDLLIHKECNEIVHDDECNASNNISQKHLPASDSGIESLSPSTHDESYISSSNIEASQIGCDSYVVLKGNYLVSGFRNADDDMVESPMDCVCEKNTTPEKADVISASTCQCVHNTDNRLSFKRIRHQRRNRSMWQSQENFDLNNSLASGICHAGSEDMRTINMDAFRISAPLAKFESVDLDTSTPTEPKESLNHKQIRSSLSSSKIPNIVTTFTNNPCLYTNNVGTEVRYRNARPQSLNVSSCTSLHRLSTFTPTPGADTDDSSPVYVFCGTKRVSEVEAEPKGIPPQEIVEMDVDGCRMVLINADTYRQIMDEISQLKGHLATLTSIIQNGDEAARNSLILQERLDTSNLHP